MRTLLSILIILLLSACSSVRVETDYSPTFTFDQLSSFALLHEREDGVDSLTDTRIISALEKELFAKGYHEQARDKADFYLLYHTDVRNKTRIDTDYQAVGMYPYAYGYQSMMLPSTRVYSYDEAKLIVDIVDPATKTIVWQGIATDKLRSYETPQERTAYIQKVIASLLRHFPPKKEGR